MAMKFAADSLRVHVYVGRSVAAWIGIALGYACAWSAFGGDAVSRPAGFMHIRVPAHTSIPATMSFYPFDESIQSIMRRQWLVTTNAVGSGRILKWDSASIAYLAAVRSTNSLNPAARDLWVDDSDRMRASGMTLVPGEGFWLENGSDIERDAYLCGYVLLSPWYDIPLSPGLNLVGYPYATEGRLDGSGVHYDGSKSVGDWDHADVITFPATSSAESALQFWLVYDELSPYGSALVDADRLKHSPLLPMGRGFWYHRKASSPLTWSEAVPYSDPFSTNDVLPLISDVFPDAAGNMQLLITCDGKPGEVLDVLYKDLRAGEKLVTDSGWKVAEAGISTYSAATYGDYSNGTHVIGWLDDGLRTGGRQAMEVAMARYYLVASEFDSDGDGLSDALEAFVHGTDPRGPDSDGDGMPDGWELTHGLNPRLDNAGDDSDRDGLTNLREYFENRDPRHARSKNQTIYVDANTGDDLRDGFSKVPAKDSGPKKTIQAALSAAIPGDDIVVAEGTYLEEVGVPSGIRMHTNGKVSILRPSGQE